MVMTNKIIIIVMLIACIITLSLGVCFADYSTTAISPTTVNSNITNISYNASSPLPFINDLKTNNYKSVFSKYSSPKTRVTISDINIEFYFIYRPSVYNDTAFSEFQSYNNYFVNTFEFNYLAQNVDSSQLNFSSNAYKYSATYYIDFRIYGSLSFDMPLDNFSLESNSNTPITSIGGFTCSMLTMLFTLNGYTFTLESYYTFANTYNYTITFDFDPMVTTCDGVLFGSYSNFYSLSSTLYNFDLSDNSISSKLNNNTYTYTPTNSFDRIFYNVTMLNDSDISKLSYSIARTQTGNKQFSSVDNSGFGYGFYITSPLPYNNNEYFTPSGENNTDTPLKLQYYEAEWYQLHYQIANAFIFMITELPIVSDVTNVIYSIINLIKNAFDVLTQFSGFGYIFAFAMFAIVAGLLIKLFMGD